MILEADWNQKREMEAVSLIVSERSAILENSFAVVVAAVVVVVVAVVAWQKQAMEFGGNLPESFPPDSDDDLH